MLLLKTDGSEIARHVELIQGLAGDLALPQLDHLLTYPYVKR